MVAFVASSALFKVCTEDGFFFLMDLRDDPEGERLLREAGMFFDLDEKMRHMMGGGRSVFGYV